MSIRRATTVVTLAALALVACSDDEPSDEAREVTTSTSHPSATTTTTSTEPDLRLVTIGDSIPYGLGDCGGCDTFTTLFSDFEGSCLTVRRTITTIRHQPVAGDVKSARSRRTLDVDAATHGRPAVASDCAARAADAHGGRIRRPGPRVRHAGRPALEPRHDHAGLRTARPCVRPARVRLHDLRHAHASHLLAAGVNVKVVSERLGHASVAFTLDVYGHVLPGQQADAAAAVAALVDGL